MTMQSLLLFQLIPEAMLIFGLCSSNSFIMKHMQSDVECTLLISN